MNTNQELRKIKKLLTYVIAHKGQCSGLIKKDPGCYNCVLAKYCHDVSLITTDTYLTIEAKLEFAVNEYLKYFPEDKEELMEMLL